MSYPEAPDASGKAPEHRDAKLRAQAKGACNKPMVRGENKHATKIVIYVGELWHGTSEEGANKILTTKTFNVSKFSSEDLEIPADLGVGSYFSLNYETAGQYGDTIIKAKTTHPLTLYDISDLTEKGYVQQNSQELQEAGFDGAIYRHGNTAEQEVIIFQPKGKIIPLYDVGQTDLAPEIAMVLHKQITKKTPQPDELYHVTFKSKSNKLLKEGIIPKKSSTYKNRVGGELKDSDTIYVFSNFDDAVRWASKMQFDFKKPTIIVAFRGNISEWGIDTHWQSAGAKGKWLKKKGTISPEDIIELIGVSQRMTQAVVQTGGTSKELTRMNGIMEMV